MIRPLSALAALAVLSAGVATAQVSSYAFSSEIGDWHPLAGNGTPLGMPNMPPAFDTYDDNSFVQQGTQLLLGFASTGNGWPIGFTFHYNGQAYDRVGLSIEGWLAFGKSSDGNNAVFVPIGASAYVPLSSALPAGMDAGMRNRVAGFAADLRAQGAGGTWPLQIATMGQAPHRRFVAEWNVMRSGGAPQTDWLSFQVQLHEGGGDPAQQVVKVVYGQMAQGTALAGQVGLGGTSPDDFNNRSVAASPYDWQLGQAGTANTATCRLPATGSPVPQGLTFTWTPAGCVVSGIAVTDLAMTGGTVHGTLAWEPLTGTSSYAYRITTGGPDGTVVASGNGISGTSAALAGLPAGAELFAYVQADCAGEQEWGGGLPFTTAGITEIVCGQPPHQDSHCYGNLEQTTWHYNSSSGAPMRMFIHAGTIHYGDLLTVHDGTSTAAPLLFSSATGDIAGQMITSTGPSITMKLASDVNGSCASQDFIPPMEWEVGCFDCDPVMANYQVLDDCPNGQFSVQVSIFAMGDAASVAITNNGGAPLVNASSPGTYTVGPFAIGTPVVVVAENAYNLYCSSSSGPVINGACPLVDCGPTDHAYCYTNNDASTFAYQSVDNERIGIRFRSGGLAPGDQLRIYDGLDPFMSAPLFSGDNGGDLTNLMVVTSLANADHALLLELDANASGSCATGQAAPWDYVVACYDGCLPPEAAFTTVRDCAMGTYAVVVDLTAMGSASSLLIVADAGAAQVVADGPGSYSVGPFPIGQAVTVELVGAGVLCVLGSGTLNEECDVSVSEVDNESQVQVFPNPGDGTFRLVMPMGFGGRGRLEVLDVSGRSVAVQMLQGYRSRGVDCDLGHLPAGRYTLVLTSDGARAYAPIVIMR